MVDRERMISRQKDLSELIGCSGREKLVREYIHRTIRPFVDDLFEDSNGNLIAVQRGEDPEISKKILLDAHMDEVGFMVNHIESDGSLRVAALGGIDPLLLSGTPVQFLNKRDEVVPGTFASIPPHVKNSLNSNGGVPKIDELSVDIGAASPEECAEMGIEIGSSGTFATPFTRVGEHSLMGKAFDDRSGCNILIETAQNLAENRSEHCIIFLFSVSEEHKQLGVSGLDLPVKPDTALVLENTTATDTAGTPERFKVAQLDHGPVFSLADKNYIVPERIVKDLIQMAEASQLKWQYKKPGFGGTNAGALVTAQKGIPTGIVSVPCRYIHAPAGIIRIEDLTQSAELVYQFCRKE